MADNEHVDIDFGDEELNDPEYETKVESADNDSKVDAQSSDDSTQSAEKVDATEQAQPADTVKPQDGAGGDGQPKQADERPADNTDQRNARSDKDGNLIDANGNVLAAAGKERRMYERTQQQSTYIKRLESENAQYKTDSDLGQVLNGVPKQLNLNNEEAQMGLQAIASFKKDPVATARWMLQETMKLGYNLEQVVGADGQGKMNGGSLDLQAIKSMIGEAMSPLVSDRNAQEQQTAQQQSAQRETEKFFANHDNAHMHEDVLVNMMSNDDNLTPEVAYWQLREYAAKNQLDFNQPLRAQAVAKQGGQTQQNGNAAQQSQTSQVPMPNGAGVSSNAADMQASSTYANADDSWDHIVKQSLASAGFSN